LHHHTDDQDDSIGHDDGHLEPLPPRWLRPHSGQSATSRPGYEVRPRFYGSPAAARVTFRSMDTIETRLAALEKSARRWRCGSRQMAPSRHGRRFAGRERPPSRTLQRTGRYSRS
jgi:hypothetical protein